MSHLLNKGFYWYLLKFFLAFCVLFYGTIAWIGITYPGGYHSEFIQQYLDYVSLLRASLLYGSKSLLALMGYHTVIPDVFSLKLVQGRGVHIGFDCIGYGVMSFWGAFVFANKGSFAKKLKWVLFGLLLIWLINITRISLLLIAINKHAKMFLGISHHTWFNIAAYTCIFTLIYFFDHSTKDTAAVKNEQ